MPTLFTALGAHRKPRKRRAVAQPAIPGGALCRARRPIWSRWRPLLLYLDTSLSVVTCDIVAHASTTAAFVGNRLECWEDHAGCRTLSIICKPWVKGYTVQIAEHVS